VGAAQHQGTGPGGVGCRALAGLCSIRVLAGGLCSIRVLAGAVQHYCIRVCVGGLCSISVLAEWRGLRSISVLARAVQHQRMRGRVYTGVYKRHASPRQPALRSPASATSPLRSSPSFAWQHAMLYSAVIFSPSLSSFGLPLRTDGACGQGTGGGDREQVACAPEALQPSSWKGQRLLK
jgi:hypothetical protein